MDQKKRGKVEGGKRKEKVEQKKKGENGEEPRLKKLQLIRSVVWKTVIFAHYSV